MVSVELLQKDEPYYVPGYGGYCPRNPFVCGENYGDMVYANLRDPGVSHADKLVLTDRKNFSGAIKPSCSDIKLVESRNEDRNALYNHPMVPGYGGFVPHTRGIVEKLYSVTSTQGLADFERDQRNQRASRAQLKKIVSLQSGYEFPTNTEERLLLKTKFRLPLIEVRPERAGVIKGNTTNEPYERPRDYGVSPYYMENANPKKYFVNGYTGYVPLRHFYFGKPYQIMTNQSLINFTTGQLEKKRNEWKPIVVPKIKTEPKGDSHLIYQKDTYIMPNYTGFIPGKKFRIGKTHGYSSKLANQVIEEQLFKYKYRKC